MRSKKIPHSSLSKAHTLFAPGLNKWSGQWFLFIRSPKTPKSYDKSTNKKVEQIPEMYSLKILKIEGAFSVAHFRNFAYIIDEYWALFLSKKKIYSQKNINYTNF